jgi:hypothetical protein
MPLRPIPTNDTGQQITGFILNEWHFIRQQIGAFKAGMEQGKSKEPARPEHPVDGPKHGLKIRYIHHRHLGDGNIKMIIDQAPQMVGVLNLMGEISQIMSLFGRFNQLGRNINPNHLSRSRPGQKSGNIPLPTGDITHPCPRQPAPEKELESFQKEVPQTGFIGQKPVNKFNIKALVLVVNCFNHQLFPLFNSIQPGSVQNAT